MAMADNYFPVPLKRIVVDTVPNFDLFIKQKERYVLYRKANYTFTKENLRNLIDNRIEDLFVQKRDLKLYEQYRLQVREETEEEFKAKGFEGIFCDPEEVNRYHAILGNYHSVDNRLFVEGAEIDFPVYAHVENDVALFPEIESKKEGPWELTPSICSFKKEIMIRKTDMPKYRAFVEKMMASPSGADQPALMRKATALREMSKIVVQDVLDDPRSGEKMKKVGDSVNNMVDFILENETSYFSLMTISAHDFYTYTHSLNVCTFSLGLGSAIGLPKTPDLEMLGLGTMLHDIGKSQVDSKLINKPGRLTDEEFMAMKNHVTLGVNLLKEHHNLPAQVMEPVAQHHEKLTGSGYPNGIKGDQLTLFGRISSIVDIYDALTTVRSYKKAFTPFEALSILAKNEDDYDHQLLREVVLMLGRQVKSAGKA
ncbi:MAG: HD-GYP domain-containing protein [Candidatus Glassbacteria bacterium]|nr:HD-GYP domain-containing protein [Candidatus Glassbacteria bacterium]